MFREWWNKKSEKERWKIKASIIWFGGGFTILFAIVEIFFMPKIRNFISQASPSKVMEVENFIQSRMIWVVFILICIVFFSIMLNVYLDRKESKNIEER